MRGLGLSAIAMAAALASGCRSSGGECETDDHEDVAGTWELTTVVTSSCDPEDVGEEDTEVATVVQDGGQLTIDGLGVDLDGSICGASFSARGTSTESVGACTYSVSVTVSGAVDGDTAEGDYRSTMQVPDPEACLSLLTSCTTSYSYSAERIP
jgi:hypothetical protein